MLSNFKEILWNTCIQSDFDKTLVIIFYKLCTNFKEMCKRNLSPPPNLLIARWTQGRGPIVSELPKILNFQNFEEMYLTINVPKVKRTRIINKICKSIRTIFYRQFQGYLRDIFKNFSTFFQNNTQASKKYSPHKTFIRNIFPKFPLLPFC